MIPAHFGQVALHPDRLSEDGGSLDKLFVRLVYDLFASDCPTLTYHDRGGKDGAIDLWFDASSQRLVFECKQIGNDIKPQPWEAARARWRKVRSNLDKNLPQGVDVCDGPYRTWFSDSPRIVKYSFVVSCPIFPLVHKDDLRQEIEGAFEALSLKSDDLPT